MPIVFYYLPISPPCRAVEMTAEHLGIQLVKKHVDLLNGEHLKPEFLEINSQHCVPTIVDEGFILWESRAIMTYLANKYAPDSPLYPKDPKARALVDKMLYFDTGTLFKASREFHRPQLFEGKPKDPEKENNLKSALRILEKILENTSYAAGDHVTLADYSILATLVFEEVLLDFTYAEFPRISDWLRRMKEEAPKYKEINEVPLRKFKDVMKVKMGRT